MKKEIKQELTLAKSIRNLAEVQETLIDSMVNITKEIKTLQDSQITLCNRLNEIELNLEEPYKPLVTPVIEQRKCNLLIETPYPKPTGKVRKAVNHLKRLVDAST